MPDRILPGGLGLRGFWDLGADTWKPGMDLNLLKLSALTQLVVIDVVNATPGSPTDGDIYAFGDTHPTNPDSIAIRDNAAWTYLPMQEGWLLFDNAANAFKWFNGTTLVALASGGGGSLEREVIGFATTAPTASEVLTDAPSARAWTLPADMAGTKVSVGTNPAATFVLSVRRNNIEVGTISISTAGVATLATSGGTSKAFAVGDLLTVRAPAGVDASIARLAYSILGTL